LGLPDGGFKFDNYVAIFQEQTMAGYFLNSTIVTLFSVSFTLLLAAMVAFGITRMNNWIGNVLFAVFTLGMMVPAQVIMVPLYSLMLDLG
ncbi:hypothetical protein RLL78_00830, partial [Streptococcus pneumoniae]|nr:hypothetical protein [Streptococcus pneumoniae]